ncbi:hypothetical protein [Fibrella aquatica]|uniref:hypothetical protein n=1 Tax=Fibrella aquatica TaxID=3242487 RepID=UPI0035211FC4
MKQRSLSVLLLLALVTCQRKQATSDTTSPDSLVSKASIIESATETSAQSPDNFLIIPGLQVGSIHADATEAGLIDILGNKNVVRDTIYVAEGTYEIGTTIFKNTADQAQILWADNRRFARPQSVLIRPARDQDGHLRPGTAGPVTQWITGQKIRPGMSLRDVEKQNGNPFSLYGFDWDYGGWSTSWKGGALEQQDGKTLISLGFGVSESMTGAQEKLYESLMGDQEFLSSNPAMQQLNPTVQNLTISFQ